MIGPHHPSASVRGWLGVALRWTAALVVLFLLFHFLPLEPLRAALARIPSSRFLAILLGYLLAHFVGINKWRMVVNAAQAELDFRASAQCYMGGLFATLFLPSIIGGDIVRLAVGLRRSPRPAAVLAGNLVDRFLDVFSQAGLVLLGLFLLPGSLPQVWQSLARGASLIGVGIALAVAILTALLYKPFARGCSLPFLRQLARLKRALRAVSRRPLTLVFGWMLGIVVQGAFLVLTALLADSCGLVLPLRVWLVVWPLAKLAAVLPLTQGGVGIREAALVALLLPFGVPSWLALAAGLAWEGVVIVGGLIAGLSALLLRHYASTPGAVAEV